MTNSIVLRYPLPHPKLSPNVYANRYELSRLKRKRKRNVVLETIMHVRNAGLEDNLKWRHVKADIMWYHKMGQRPDRDNAIASLKSTFDGIEKAKLMLNDRYLRPMPPEFERDENDPRVVITITETDADGEV